MSEVTFDLDLACISENPEISVSSSTRRRTAVVFCNSARAQLSSEDKALVSGSCCMIGADCLGPPEFHKQLTAVVGDLDSIPAEQIGKLQDEGIDVIRVWDQDRHDLDKAIDFLSQHDNFADFDYILVFGALGGRIDQEMANINMLFKYAVDPVFSGKRILLLDSENCLALLLPGKWRILLGEKDTERHSTCGLIPIGGACVVSSRGLGWNLSERVLEFGGLVSSSNFIDSSVVEIEVVKNPLLFSLQRSVSMKS
jgi:thiamine pyrophosphokinase